MEVRSDFEESLLRNLKLDEPWLPPKPWESVPSESGGSISHSSNHVSSRDCIYDISSLSEASVVCLVMNALQGIQSAVVSIDQLSALFFADPADRSSHRIPTLWNRSLSTCVLGKMLRCIACSGTLVILLRKFVYYFTSPLFEGSLTERQVVEQEAADNQTNAGKNMEHPPRSLVNQAFAVAIQKILEGYLCALDTLNASAHVRRSFDSVNLQSNSSRWHGSLTSVSRSDITLLEVYLHTKELRTQIEALGNLCYLHDAALCFSQKSFEELMTNVAMEFRNFPRGANLLTYLYEQLQVVDPAHSTLLKYLFLRSLEPYCSFIRSWIYEAKINDPYGEFIVEYKVEPLPYLRGKAGIPVDFPLATVREQDAVALPCFLKTVSVPLLRAGQQLQVVMRLLQLCNYVHAGEYTFEDILPGASDPPSGRISSSPLTFSKEEIEATVLSRRDFYSKMQEKLEKVMDTLDMHYHQVVLHDSAVNAGPIDVQCSSTLEEMQVPHAAADDRDMNRVSQNMDSEASSMDEDLGFAVDLESSECSSIDDSEGQADSTNSHEVHYGLVCSKRSYLSSLCFSSLSSDKDPLKMSQTEQQFSIPNKLADSDIGESIIGKYNDSDKEAVELSSSCVSGIKYAGHVPGLGWPVGGLLRNPLSTGIRYRDGGDFHVTSSGHGTWASNRGRIGESVSCSSDKSSVGGVLMHDLSKEHEYLPANSFLIQSWNVKYPCNVLSMNPMLTKNAFFYDGSKPRESALGISKALPYFDFSSARDPFGIYMDRLPADESNHVALVPSSSVGTSACHKVNGCGKEGYNADDIPPCKAHMEQGGAPSDLKRGSIDAVLRNGCGGSSWQRLLRGSPISNISDAAVRGHVHEHRSGDNFQIPLDFIIDKCLLQEIMLQYIYVSRLSIKMLEGGFDLQEHFQSLRRYHFMEIADWADLFVTSLLHHKWYFMEAEQKIPEIQGLLELSIQRSSCERDHNKDRLYVYMKDQDRTPFSTTAFGVHSFDFIGLGYRVDWPISIVLTPSALGVYAEIFTFLIQIKLAVLSLADVWCSLKEFRHLFGQSNGWRQSMRNDFNYLVKLRHQVNHFVLALQQYVLSQLSHVSWCRFHYSLKHEVKDMMDLESVHMAYLMDSMHICFLAEETLSVSNNIESILQCGLDFRSCILKGTRDVRSDNQDSTGSILQINVSQAHSLKEKFCHSLKELHKSYLKSPKHGKFGLPHFWSYLNYNEYYSDAFGNDIFHYNPSVE